MTDKKLKMTDDKGNDISEEFALRWMVENLNTPDHLIKDAMNSENPVQAFQQLFDLPVHDHKTWDPEEPVEELTRKERYAICKSCDRFSSIGICKECGCVMKLKTAFKMFSCPIGKW